MRAVIQRVSNAKVEVNQYVAGEIKQGILVLLGIEEADTKEDVQWLSRKIASLRIFNDDKEVMNLSVQEVGGEVLVVSQFTLHAKTKKGTRPSYIRAARPNVAIPLYEQFIKMMEMETGKPIQSGNFGASMKVSLVNDGPVTIIIDTKKRE